MSRNVMYLIIVGILVLGTSLIEATNLTSAVAAVKLPPAHAVSTCSFDDSSQPSYQSHYLQSATSEVSNMEFVVPPGTKGCLLVFSCAANTDPDYDGGQAMTVRASVNSFLNATLYAEDGTVLVPLVTASKVVSTTVAAPSTLLVAFQDSGVSTSELGRLALSIACVKAKTWIGALPDASRTNILGGSSSVTTPSTASSSYTSWVTPVASSSGGYSGGDRKAFFFTCPLSTGSSSSTDLNIPLLIRGSQGMELQEVNGFTNQKAQSDQLHVINTERSESLFLTRVVNWKKSMNREFAVSGSGFYAIWGSSSGNSSVAGLTITYTCAESQWRISGLGIEPEAKDTGNSWVAATIIILLVALVLLFFILAVVYYCCRPDEGSEYHPPTTTTQVVSTSKEPIEKSVVPEVSSTSKDEHIPKGSDLNGSHSTATTSTVDVDKKATVDEDVSNPLAGPSHGVLAGHNQMRVQAAITPPVVQYFPNRTSSATPWKPAPSIFSSESSVCRPPPSQGDTAEYRSEVGDIHSTIDSEVGGLAIPRNSALAMDSASSSPLPAPSAILPYNPANGRTGAGGSPARRGGSPQRGRGNNSPQQQAPKVAGFSSPPRHLTPLDAVDNVDGGIMPYRPVSPTARGSPLPGLAALGGGSFSNAGPTDRFSAPWMKAYPPPQPKPESPPDL